MDPTAPAPTTPTPPVVDSQTYSPPPPPPTPTTPSPPVAPVSPPVPNEPSVVVNVSNAPTDNTPPAPPPKKKWGTGAIVGSLMALVVLVLGAVVFGPRLLQKPTNPPSFAASCSCAPNGGHGSCGGRDTIPNISCDGDGGAPKLGWANACCNPTPTEPTTPPAGSGGTASCASKAGQSGGVCSGQFSLACGGDNCQTRCEGNVWKLTGNACPPGNSGDDTSSGSTPTYNGGAPQPPAIPPSSCGGSNCRLYSAGPLTGGGNCVASSTQVYSCCPSGTAISGNACVASSSGNGGTPGTVTSSNFGVCYDPNGLSGTPKFIKACVNGSGSKYCNSSGCSLPPGQTCWITHFVCNAVNAPNCNDRVVSGNSFTGNNCGTEQIDLNCGNASAITYFEFASQSYSKACGATPNVPPVSPKGCFERCNLGGNDCSSGLSCTNNNGVAICYASSCTPPSTPPPGPSTPPSTSSFACKQVAVLSITRAGVAVANPTLDKIQVGDVVTFRGTATAVNTTVSALKFTLTKGGVAQAPVSKTATNVSGQYQADFTVTVDTATSYAVSSVPVSP